MAPTAVTRSPCTVTRLMMVVLGVAVVALATTLRRLILRLSSQGGDPGHQGEDGGRWWQRAPIAVPSLSPDAHWHVAGHVLTGSTGTERAPATSIADVMPLLRLPTGLRGDDWRASWPKQPMPGVEDWLLSSAEVAAAGRDGKTTEVADGAAAGTQQPLPTHPPQDEDDVDMVFPRPGQGEQPERGEEREGGGAHGSGSDPFFGSAADLQHHHTDRTCWSHFDFGMLTEWDAAAKLFCVPDGWDGTTDVDRNVAAAVASDAAVPGTQLLSALQPFTPVATWLVCRVHVDGHLPAPTGPHTMCDGANIVLDVDRMTPTACLQFRQGYKCDGPPIHWTYGAGAIGGSCQRRPSFQSNAFPRDHLMDLFAPFDNGMSASSVMSVPAAAGPITLIVTRERGEHANMFHATSDLMNAFFTLHVTGVIDGLKGDRAGMDQVQLLLLDEQTGPFEAGYWKRIYSPAYPILRASQLRAAGTPRIRFRRALFVPPGYSNLMLAHVMTEGDCHAGTQLFQSFRRFFLSGAGLHAHLKPTTFPHRVRVSFISRRPYNEHGVDHTFMGRQVDNEDELLRVLATDERVEVTRYDFALLSPEQQLEIVAGTEVMVAMHGAALTYAFFMPPHAGVLEFWPKDRDMWRCFEHITTMAGLVYRRWENRDPSRFRTDSGGDYTRVDVGAVLPMFQDMVTTVLGNRDKLRSGGMPGV